MHHKSSSLAQFYKEVIADQKALPVNPTKVPHKEVVAVDAH